MQTFLPYPDFVRSAKCLDWRRLGKQRVEVLQILATLNGASKGWKNHPAVRMWDGYTEALIEYGCEICTEWINRGYRDNCLEKICNFSWGDEPTLPPWLGRPSFHASHRSNLLRKDPDWYGQWGWTEPDNIPYEWP